MRASDERSLGDKPTPADVTIALCTIGRQGLLQQAVRSLLATTPPDVGLIVVMNAPDDSRLIDEIRPLVGEWRGPSEMVLLDSRVGIAASHSAALDRVRTDFVTFMGDDDLVLEPRIDRILELFWSTKPTPAVIGSYCRRVSGTAEQPVFSTNKDYGPTTVDEWRRIKDDGDLIEIVFPSAIYRTGRLREIGGFEERFGSAMDLATFTILGQLEPVLADPRRTFAHRIHDGSVTSSSAIGHSARLRYVDACIRALRSGEAQPSFEDFTTMESGLPVLKRMSMRRSATSAALFRQGGASIVSGNRTRGGLKVLASLALSPSVFRRRSGAQVTQEADAQRVVTILVKNCNHYRVPFYEQLRDRLRDRDIELRLVVADGLPEDAAKGDRASLPWAEVRPLRTLTVRGRTLLWQPGFDIAWASDLVITEQASKQLFNVALSYLQRPLRTRHAFWGHGRNFQASIEGTAGEGLKQRLTTRAHWFFAYNDLSAAAAIESGMAPDRVTTVMNASDTTSIRRVRQALEPEVERTVRHELDIGDGPVALFLGGLYPLKRPQFLIEAAQAIRQKHRSFELLVIGDGTEAHVVVDAAKRFDWIHHVGAVYDDDRVRLASVASLHLMPGAIGLNIVDAFALGLPTVTVDLPYHGPEIGYLQPGVNGEIVDGDATPEDFADAVSSIIGDTNRLSALQAGAEVSGRELSIEHMADRFAAGVIEALER